MLGPPGAGQRDAGWTAGEQPGQSPGLRPGDLFREHRQKDTELGRLAQSYMVKGVLVPDDVTIRMVTDWINESEQAQGFVLDGFPRNIAQAQALDRELAGSGGIDLVLSHQGLRKRASEKAGRAAGMQELPDCLPRALLSTRGGSGVRSDGGGELYQREDDRPEAVKNAH